MQDTREHDMNPDLWDQLVVRVWKWCNFRCNFCNVSDNERHVELKENVDDIVRNFHYKMKYSNFTAKTIEITISWGEPSIFQKETIFALKYISRFFEKRDIKCVFWIQTNASNIDERFAKKISELWIKYALVSFHTIDPKIFKQTLWISYETYFHKIIEGMQCLQQAGIQVDTNTILSQENRDNFFDTLIFLEWHFPQIQNFNVGVIQPHGEAEKNLTEVAPKYEEIADIYNTTISYLQWKNKRVTSHFVWLPACYLEDHSVSLEIQSNTLFRQNFNFDAHYLINNINDVNKIQIDGCNSCLYNNICSGIWKKYQWYQAVKPVEYVKDFFLDFIKNDIAYKLQGKNESLSEIYEKWFQQILVPSDLGERSEIISLLQEAIQIGFYKLSLIIVDDFEIDEDILYSGLTNIQIFDTFIESWILEYISQFSQKNWPQFRIDLDIILSDKNYFYKNYDTRFIHLYSIEKDTKKVTKL